MLSSAAARRSTAFNETYPGRLRRRCVEPGQDEEFSGACSRDIPEPDALPIQFFLLRLTRGLVAVGSDAEDRAVKGLGLAVDNGAVRGHDAGRSVDRLRAS